MFGNENINFEVFNGYEGIMSVERLSKLTSKELGDISEDILRANDFKLDNIVTDTLLKKASKSSHLYLI